METRFQTTSFIPKASLDNVVGDDGRLQKQSTGGHSGSLFTLLAFFIFVCSLVAAGVVFSLLKLSSSNKVTAEKNLKIYQARSNTETIEGIKALNNRLNILSVLVSKHVAVVPLFGEIGRNTLDKVSYTSFSLKRKTDGTYALIMKAQGVGYESIVVQDKQFSDPEVQRIFKNTSITDFSKQKGQDLTSFTVNTTVVENAVNFASLIPKTAPGATASTTPTKKP